MKARVVMELNLDPLSHDQRKIEFQLRTALCLLAHPDSTLQVEAAPVLGVVLESVELEEP